MNNEEIIEGFSKAFDEIDTKGDELINSTQFFQLYKQLMDDENLTKKKSDVIFSGIDISNSGTISKIEFMKVVKMEVYGDELAQYKLIFRAFDTKRIGALTTESVVSIGKFVGKHISKSEAETVLFNETGTKEGKMTFPVFFKMMTGRDIDPKADPYEGRLKSNSSCCLLI